MDEKTIGKLTFKAIHELKIDVPIMKVDVVGDQIELSLYGGRVVRYPPESISPSPLPSPAGRGSSIAGYAASSIAGYAACRIAEYNDPAVRDLESLELETLKDLARRKGILINKKTTRQQLIKALRSTKR